VIPGHGKAAAFYILLPISYLLLFSAGLLVLSRYYRHIFHLTAILLGACTLIVRASGTEIANLELLSIGFLGVLAGQAPIDRISGAISRLGGVLILTYVCYTATITFVPVGYTLQVISVVLNLMLLYLIGMNRQKGGGVLHEPIVLLGKYSLFGYIAQIGILQVLYRISVHVGTGTGIYGLALLGTIVLTALSVVMLDHARESGRRVDKVYRAVFA
jgi:hypothetical protein